MKKQESVNGDVVKGVLNSFGFPPDRVQKAIACLLNKNNPELEADCALLSIPEAAKRLGISRAHFYRLSIPRVKISRRTLISVKDLDTFVSAHRKMPE